jgi:glycosyltransferase involved in cell wall biosynthesis
MSQVRNSRVLVCCGGMVSPGGAERMTFAVIEGLAQSGAAVHCIVNDWASDAIVDLIDRLGLTWSTSSYRELLVRPTRKPRAMARLALDLWRTHWDVAVSAWRFRPTHVLIPGYDVVLRSLLTFLALRMLGVIVVFKVANVPDPSPYHRRLWRRWISSGVSVFVANSAFTRCELLAAGVKARKVVTVAECLPSRLETPSPDEPPVAGRLVYVGQIIPGKGLHVLLEALALMRKARPDITLDVIGDMDGWEAPGYRGYRNHLRQRASEPDLEGRVRFLGWQEHVPPLMRRAELHCCPSLPELRESFGLVVLEAKSVGVPSVVFPSGALPELVTHGLDGWSCASPTAEALAEACLALLGNPESVTRFRRAARASAARFSRERFTECWRAIFGDTQGSLSGADRSVPRQAAGLRS